MHCGHPVQAITADDRERLTQLISSAPAPLAEKVRAAVDLSGERRMVTVLFVDVVGSSALAESLDPETYSRIMTGAFERITPVIYHYEGTVARLVGDALVAFFGAPVAHEDDPIRAVRAGLDILAEAGKYAGEVQDLFGVDFAMRVALNHGPVVIETHRGELNYDFTPLGGVVNLAARIKYAAGTMNAIMTEDVYRFVEPLYDFEDLGLVEVRGRKEPPHVYRVLGEKRSPGSLRGVAGLESPMVGRDAELRRLVELSAALQVGLGRGVVILGEAGLGKSRLTAEWQVSVTRSSTGPLPKWSQGRCLPYGRGLAYHLLVDLLRSLLGITDTTDETCADKALRDTLADLFDTSPETPPADIYPFLAHLLSINITGDAYKRLPLIDPQALQVHYREAFQVLLEALMSSRPQVIVIEDLHWGDPSSVEVLGQVLPLARTHPILFCLVSRPETDTPGWQLVRRVREILGGSLAEISLGSLSEPDSRRLISNLLEIEALDEGMRSLILRRSEGNPFYVEEVIRMLIEQGAITREAGGWSASARINEVHIPENLQGLLMARIDRLPEADRDTLRVASVVGRQFPVKVLDYVLTGSSGSSTESDISGWKQQPGVESTRQNLGSLESAGLVAVAHVEPELEYLFRHTMIQDAAYASLLFADRARLHQAVGEAVEALYPDRLSEFAAMLARHYGAAGVEDRSVKYCSMAGDAALAAFANQEAEGHYRCALDFTYPMQERAELLTKLGEALFAQSRFRQAIEAWKEGIDLYSQLRDYNGITRLYARYARAEWHADDTPESLRVSLEALGNVPKELNSPEMAGLLHEIGRAYYFNGQPDEAKAFCQRALGMAETHQAVDIQADTLTTLGVGYTDDPKLAYNYLDQAVRLAEENGLLIIAGRAHHNMSNIQAVLFSDLPGAREHLLKAAEIYRQHGNNQRAFFSLIGVISLSFQIGDIIMARQHMAIARELVDTLPEKSIVELELRFVELVLMAFTGQLEQGRKLLPEMKALANERGNLQMASNIANMIILVGLDMDRYLGQHDLSQAIAASEEALVFAEQGFGDRVSARSQHGILMCRVGRLEEAYHNLNLVMELANPDLAPDAQSLLDIQFELAWAEKRLDDAILFQEELVDRELNDGRRWVYARDMISLADVYVQRGEVDDFGRAQKAYQTSLEIFTEMEILFYQNVIEERIRLLEEKTRVTLHDSRKVAYELSQAGKIQSSFLPQKVPDLEGWSISVVLEPARETSGDYYDFISLPDRKLGILVADVTDKGAGAALFMASSRTLIRTYASLYPEDPAEVIRAANDRLVQDTHEGLYVTLFYAVLDPISGSMIYCNAGHNPPYLFRAGGSGEELELRSTGMTMGIFDNETWDQREIQLIAGDVLLMFTDGVPDAENPEGEFYEQDRLVSAARRAIADTSADAQEIQDVILSEIHEFIKGAPRVDDLTLAVLVRIST